MKLNEEYVIMKSYKVITWFIAYVVFFMIFWSHVKSLNAGGVLFVYECMLLVFLLRYLRQYIYIRTAKMMGKDVEGSSLSLNPTFWSSSEYNLKEVLTMELRPMIILTTGQIIGILISHFVFSATLITPILLGGLILSLAVYNQSYMILFRCLRHGESTYKYGFEAFKVYQGEGWITWPTAEKLIRIILNN
ncbi:hypothetical protein EZV73_14915 [Acidaminobacter sp. JC074]|uniref:hypothetical protein n=1 Tax=Acidaminobacter sp. JC074 TaxID=2530199 RepID=UPI001F0FC213|nr:hypothetical protein [Acidaminobacter sp. JC074]MCH4888885.1 hypothetical protein [Acidaminobacter sp. JC074]